MLALQGLSKAWFGVPAVADLTLSVDRGEVLGLIGENGAGKSTLMNMIGGVTPPTAGSMRWQGAPYAPRAPADASEAGIAFIHQELNLFTNLTIAENIYIDALPSRFGFVDRGAMRARTAELLARLDLNAAPDTAVDVLAPGERQLVEIAKALHREARLIIFDEPTTSLTPRETARLFEVIDLLRAEDRAVIYISHILGDVARLSDRVAVLRDGRLVAEGPMADFDVPKMIGAMIGRSLGGMYPARSAAPRDDVVLEARGLGQPGVLANVSLTVRAGEILGLFGLMGAGRSELARCLAGLDPLATGAVTLNGAPLTGGPRRRIRQGLAFVTENRREEGLLLAAPIAQNLSLVALEDFAGRAGVIDAAAHAARTQAARDELSIKATDIARQPARALSGGNQQKVVIGKWLLAGPKLLILDEPTRGVDVGARHEIYALADRLAARGDGILMISSELEELMGMCDRILVMRQGEVVGGFDRADFDDAAILSLAFQGKAA